MDLIPAGVIDPKTRLVITNATYFKGGWVKKFDKARQRMLIPDGFRENSTGPCTCSGQMMMLYTGTRKTAITRCYRCDTSMLGVWNSP
jgi:serine protease inhibitor